MHQIQHWTFWGFDVDSTIGLPSKLSINLIIVLTIITGYSLDLKCAIMRFGTGVKFYFTLNTILISIIYPK